MSRQHFIDQEGTIVYTVNDIGANCEGCMYASRRRKLYVDCNTLVPAEHRREGAGMYCVREMKKYKKLEVK